MEQGTNCGYTGFEFGAPYPDSTCINGYLWDMDSGGRDDNGDVYLDSGGDIPCPQCNLKAYVRYMADEWSELGYLSVDHPLSTKMVKNAFQSLPANMRRCAKKHWRSGRQQALRDAFQEGQ